MWVFKLFLHLFMQPALWICILITCIAYQKRIKNERLNFRIAINHDFYEGRHLIKNGFFFCIIGSVIAFLLGTMLPVQWIIVYEILICFGLLLYLFTDTGVLCLTMALPLLWLLNQTYLGEQTILGLIKINEHFFYASGVSIFVLCTLFFLFRYLILQSVDQFSLMPSIHNGKRGRRLVRYNWRESVLVPLLILVPGDLFHSMLGFWPLFSINGQKFGLFILPFWVTGAVSFWRQPLATAVRKIRKQSLFWMVYSAIFVIISAFLPKLTIAGLLLMTFLLGVQTVMRVQKDRREGRWYAETKNGVRVIAVQPHTPAAKMNLKAGDIIISCNGINVTNEEGLYKALKRDSTYCRFRVRTYGGDLKLAESAIFADSPHEIGLIIFH
ncbi:hypothetical protein FC19_GL001352 [Liquorilactobacillus aquaticus DSM 21051]|uniref:PDZ domain-containing protein n=1 Tax=Liquorilactobacillus aquaticus DSM 21051 TaxID=1423725 RepID=A0A0R2CVJ0_9LACO|nr:PDZ domain-containing protein [Liquorilactobacillus aquaticus]KRM95873.1 hypothetical protein FC19_GL001352 [Liquorilactobacillus aquaticus DSM 21051]